MSTVVIDSAVAPAGPRGDQLSEINRKLDLMTQSILVLGQQVNYLMEEAEDNRRRRRMWDDLMDDLQPIVKDVYNVAEEQLEEMQAFVQLDDIVALLKRLVRNTRNIDEVLDYMESAQDFVRDVAPLTKEMMTAATAQLEDFERKGYFGFAKQGMYVMDQIVTSFSEDDVKQLGDNVVLILNTVKALTQPEMMNMINGLTQGFHEAEAEADAGKLHTGVFSLIGQMNDPEVRRGLAITLAAMKRISAQAPRKMPTT